MDLTDKELTKRLRVIVDLTVDENTPELLGCWAQSPSHDCWTYDSSGGTRVVSGHVMRRCLEHGLLPKPWGPLAEFEEAS
jgi:hypothetical protein